MSRATEPDDIYEGRLMALARRAGDWPLPDHPTCGVKRVSRVCGTRIAVGLVTDDAGRIARYGHALTHACALSRAAASILALSAVGRDRAAVADALEALNRVLARQDGGDHLGEVWPELEMLAPVADMPTRHESVRLPFRAVLDALDGQG